MAHSKIWVNDSLRVQPSNHKKKSDNRHSLSKPARKQRNKVSYRASRENQNKYTNRSTNAQSPLSFLDAITMLNRKVDFEKLKVQLQDLNQLVYQVNGVVQHFQQMNAHAPAHKYPYMQPPFNRHTYGQTVHQQTYPFHPYR